jgi:murein DD-endopeptidase MepM/ murein hydrolase activator NlpD
MKKIILFLLLIIIYSYSATNQSYKNTIKRVNLKLSFLAKEIINQQKKLKNINQQIKKLNNQIIFLKNYLKNSNKILKDLENSKSFYLKKQQFINNEISSFIAQNYYINNKKINTLNDLINTTLIETILKEYSKKINKLIKENEIIQENINEINKKINKIKKQKQELEHKKIKLLQLRKIQLKILNNLKYQKKLYKAKLEDILKKQKELRKKLASLNIIKPQNIETLNVKKIGNAYIRPKIAKYKGQKTIPPVRGKIIKKFGFYIDPIYKIKIHNDSITIKTKPNALIRAILPGKVIYVGNEGDKKIIFIKHNNNLFSIYGNLSKISPLIKKGSYVKKGEIIARVKNTLEFEVTYKDKAINPLQVINLK